MSPFRSSKGRSLGKLIEGFKSSTIGQGFGSGGAGGGDLTVTGGTLNPTGLIDGNYTYFAFTEPGALTAVGTGQKSFDILVVAGGGQGGHSPPGNGSGGGGGGGIAYYPDVFLGTAIYPVTVGGGGSGATWSNNTNKGSDSSFGVPGNSHYMLAKGGGGGLIQNGSESYVPGGSAGGGFP